VPVFEYKAMDKGGRKSRGVMEAADIEAARELLRQQGLYPVSLSQEKSKDIISKKSEVLFFVRKVRLKELAVVMRHMATLIESGMPLLEAIKTITDQIEGKVLRQILSKTGDMVMQGASFSGALEKHVPAFPHLYVDMIKSGEESGTLDKVLHRLADISEKEVMIKSKIISAITYPAIMIIAGFSIVSLLFMFVIPKILKMFEDMEKSLPLPTIILMKVSNFITSYWWAILGGIIFVIIFSSVWFKTDKGRYMWDKVKLNLPVTGKLTRKMIISRFSRTLGNLMGGGVSLAKSLNISGMVVANRIYSDFISSAGKEIIEGQKIAVALGKGKFFPSLVVRMIAIGEESGELENMLIKLADSYDNEIEISIATIVSLLEPVMIVGMGLMVGFIVVSVLLPIFQMGQGIR
jgi:general secretion pathway protein F